jgi:HEAT repeat protein
MAGKLITALVNRARSLFKEKTQVTIEDYEQEHLLIYHGLIGSSPDNQKAFRDVRADIQSAVSSHSSIQLGVALKLQPLYWEDKLLQIFGEFNDKERANALVTLLPATNNVEWPNLSEPLGHPDWRVRANTARILAYFQAKDALPDLARSLDDTASSGKPAFAHIARALGIIGGDQARVALTKHLNSSEPWFRVDVMAALANLPLSDIKDDFLKALLTISPLSDYIAVSVSRKMSPLHLLHTEEKDVQKGACQIIIGLLEASRQTFTKDLLGEFDFADFPGSVEDILAKDVNVLSLRAASEIASSWKVFSADDIEALDLVDQKENIDKVIMDFEKILASEQARSVIKMTISDENIQSLLKSNEIDEKKNDLRHAIKLAGQHHFDESSLLLSLLKQTDALATPALEEDLIIALGQIGDEKAARPLVDLAKALVNVSSRCSAIKSAQPVAEDEPERARLYWLILKALGNINTAESRELLINACMDFAPDKREQALLSLTALHSKFSTADVTSIITIIEEGLHDPSPSVRIAAMAAAAEVADHRFIDRILRLCDSIEVSVSRQAFKTLKKLHLKEQKDHLTNKDSRVCDAIKTKIQSENDPFKLKKLNDFLHTLS